MSTMLLLLAFHDITHPERLNTTIPWYHPCVDEFIVVCCTVGYYPQKAESVVSKCLHGVLPCPLLAF